MKSGKDFSKEFNKIRELLGIKDENVKSGRQLFMEKMEEAKNKTEKEKLKRNKAFEEILNKVKEEQKKGNKGIETLRKILKIDI